MTTYSIYFYNRIMPKMHFTKPARLLDFGCGGVGNLKNTLLTLPNVTVFGCDIKSDASSILGGNFIRGSINDAEGEYNVVTAGLFNVDYNYRGQFFIDLSNKLTSNGVAYIHLYETQENGHSDIENDIKNKIIKAGFKFSKERLNLYGAVLILTKK